MEALYNERIGPWKPWTMETVDHENFGPWKLWTVEALDRLVHGSSE